MTEQLELDLFVLHGENKDRPTYLGHQRLVEGSTAIVHRATHAFFNEEIVQKTVDVGAAEGGLLHSEPGLLRRIKHPHIVEIYDAQYPNGTFEDGMDLVTFTSPLYTGGSLRSHLSGLHAPECSGALRITGHMLKALQCLHIEHQIVHRDIKPENIFLTEEDGVWARLGDLGSAGFLGADGTTTRGACTALYQAPEVANGVYTTQSDLYSVGVVLVEALNLWRLDQIDFEDVEDRVEQGLRSRPDDAFQLDAQYPESLRQFVDRLISPTPHLRFDTVDAALHELNQIRVIDWFQTDADSTWSGTWRTRTRDKSVTVRVKRQSITRGPRSGLDEWRVSAATKAGRSLNPRIVRQGAPGDIGVNRSVFQQTHDWVTRRFPAA